MYTDCALTSAQEWALADAKRGKGKQGLLVRITLGDAFTR